jgi:hypothetical protein
MDWIHLAQDRDYWRILVNTVELSWVELSWVEFILRPTISRPVRLGIGLPFGAHDQILSLSFLSDNCFVVLRPLTRGRVCNLQSNRWLVRSLRTNNHTLPFHLRLCSLFVAYYVSQGLRWSYSNPPPHGDVNTVMSLRDSYIVRIFLSSWATGGFSRKAPFQTVSQILQRGKSRYWNKLNFCYFLI